MLKHVGIAGHLRAGFLGITLFVMLAAGAGIFAFIEISGALTRITQERVPATLAAQKLTRRAEAIIDSAPRLITTSDRDVFRTRSRHILNNVERLEEILGTLENSSLDLEAATFRAVVADLRRNLESLTETVARNLEVSREIDAALRNWDVEYRAALNLISPSLRVHRGRLDEQRAGVVQFQPNSEARRTANADLRQELRKYLPLQDLRIALAKVNDSLIEMVEGHSESEVRTNRRDLDAAMARTNRLTQDLDRNTRALMSDRLDNLRSAVTGHDSVVALHAEEMKLQRRGKFLIAKNEELSRRLNQAVDKVVARTDNKIDASVQHAERTKITGAAIILGTVVLSIVCASLIMRYYVGRNVVRRLGTVRDSMLALSRGELDHPLPQPGADEIGRMTYALTVFRDNAVRLRQRTRELQMARDEAVHSSEAKTRFLANMSHELRTPLNAVIGFSEIIQNEAVGPIGQSRYIDYAQDIHDSATHLLEVINDILDVAKAEAGKLELDDDVLELQPFVDKTLRLLNTRAGEGGVTLETDLDPDAPDLLADPRRLRQIVLNLVSNAVKFTRPGGTVRVETRARSDESLDLVIVDTGVGMSDSEIETALAPFSQIDNSFSRHAEGTGLGLPLTKHLVELHGGTFNLTSVKNSGTRIVVTFPPNRARTSNQSPRPATCPAAS